MRGADVGGRKREGTGTIAQRVEPVADRVDPPSRPRRDVLDDNETGPQLGDDSSVLIPEPGSLTVEAGTLAGCADILAREAPANEVDGGES